MPVLAITQIAGVAVFDDQIHQCLTTAGHATGLAQIPGELPRLRLVDPHQRCVDQEAMVHAERQCNLHRLHAVVPAVGVTGEVGLADAGDDHTQTAPISQGGRQGEKQQISTRHKGIGQAAGLHGKCHVTGQRGFADLTQHADIQQMVFAQPQRPGGKALPQFGQHRLTRLQFDTMPLAVVETDGLDIGVALQGMGQTGGGVLAA